MENAMNYANNKRRLQQLLQLQTTDSNISRVGAIGA
jgi:hypothetical protein